MGDLNEKNINYGALNRFYQDLKSHDLSDLNDKIDNFDLSGVYNLIYMLHPNEDYLNFSANLPNTKVRLVLQSDYNAEPSTPIDIDYSFDRINWTHYTVGNDITIPTDGKVYLRGNNDYFSVYDYDNYDDILYYHHFEFENVSQDTLYVEAHGNINSLLSKTNWNEITTLPEYCYNKMFQGCSSLTTAPELPATTLADRCYSYMFYDCTSLTTAPELPATTLAYYCYNGMFGGCTSLTTAHTLPATTLEGGCYEYMFRNCTSLTTAPELPATTLANSCYNGMFYGCTSLTTAPVLPATTLADYCYPYMFSNCTSLTTAPALPATTLANGCYSYMFYDCTSLTTAPALPATTLTNYCYSYMFRGCSRLTTAPELPATTLAGGCYSYIFQGCTSLNSIKCLATNISARNCTNGWVKNVAATGKFVKNSNMTGWTTGINGIPSGWTVEDYTEPVVKPDTLTAGQNIDITDNTISAKGYVFDETKGSLAIKYKQDDGDGGQIVSNSATGLGAVAEGYRTQATGDYGSHAEGTDTVASGAASHAEGNKATATGLGAHAEGYRTQATGKYSHVEGDYTVASNRDAHAEGWYTNATGRAAHAEGLYTDATGEYSHAEGWGLETLHNLASGGGSHTEGIGTKAINKGAHAEGYGSEQAPNTASGYGSHAEGCLTLAQNQSEHAEGSANVSHKASDNAGNAGNTQHSIGIAFGNNTGTYRKNAVEVMQNGDYYLLGVGGYQGTDTKVQNASIKTLQEVINSKGDALSAGQNIDITGGNISAKGYVFDETKGAFATKFLKDEYDGGGIGTNTASGNYGSFAEGYNNTASGEYGSHAEGFLNTASGDSAHVEGQENTATHSAAHAEGRKTNATNNGAHSEGTYSDASGLASHAEGYGSTNYHNIASGDGSHAEGVCTRSQNKSEHAEGSSNVSHKASDTYGDAGNTQHSIGIGTHYNSTKNAFEVMQNGDMYVLGVGGYQGTDTKVQNASIKTLQEYIASLEARIAALEGNTAVK